MENTKDLKDIPVGQIVARDIKCADVFGRFGIDFCCHGQVPLGEACKEAGVKLSDVEKALKQVPEPSEDYIDFEKWPLDLLVDYIVKIYHRYIREEGPAIEALLDKVCKAHGENHPSLFEVQELFYVSIHDLYHHLDKEENVLFPYIYAAVEAKLKGEPLPRFHCGSIANPIEVMKYEHETEGDRYRHITDLTGGYEAPADACNSYRLLMEKMKVFNRRLHEHIHLENNILFPRDLQLTL